MMGVLESWRTRISERIKNFRHWEKLAAGALIALAVYLFIHAERRAFRGDVSDFRAYYTAAAEMRAGRDPYAPSERPYLYPPLLAFLCMPLTSFAMPVAAAIYLLVLVITMMLALRIAPTAMLQRFNPHPSTSTLSQATMLLIPLMIDRLKSDVQMFQVNTIMLLMFTLGLHWLDRRPLLAGSALGFALNIKGQTIVMLPYLLLRRRWSAGGAMAASAVVLAVLPAAFTGWQANIKNLGTVMGGLRTFSGTHTEADAPTHLVDLTAGFSVSAISGLARVLKKAGLADWLWPLAGVLIVVVFVVVVCAYRRAGVPLLHWPPRVAQCFQPWQSTIALEWSLLIMATLVFSPQTNSRHFVLMLLPMAMGIAALLSPIAHRARMTMLAGVIVSYAALVLPPGSHHLPRLYYWRGNWFYVGGPSWGLLAALVLFLFAGLRAVKARQVTANPIEPSNHGFTWV